MKYRVVVQPYFFGTFSMIDKNPFYVESESLVYAIDIITILKAFEKQVYENDPSSNFSIQEWTGSSWVALGDDEAEVAENGHNQLKSFDIVSKK